MSLFKCPVEVINRIEKLQHDFLWHGKEKKKFHLVKWSQVCKPKKGGGLGIRALKKLNSTLLGKWLWKIGDESEGCGRMLNTTFPGMDGFFEIPSPVLLVCGKAFLLQRTCLWSRSGYAWTRLTKFAPGLIFGLGRTHWPLFFWSCSIVLLTRKLKLSATWRGKLTISVRGLISEGIWKMRRSPNSAQCWQSLGVSSSPGRAEIEEFGWPLFGGLLFLFDVYKGGGEPFFLGQLLEHESSA